MFHIMEGRSPSQIRQNLGPIPLLIFGHTRHPCFDWDMHDRNRMSVNPTDVLVWLITVENKLTY